MGSRSGVCTKDRHLGLASRGFQDNQGMAIVQGMAIANSDSCVDSEDYQEYDSDLL